MPRNVQVFLIIAGILLLANIAIGTDALMRLSHDTADNSAAVSEMRRFGLTDLCLFTEASYTRNPSLADRHTPFQDTPNALEHFPSGSLIPLPLRTERYDSLP